MLHARTRRDAEHERRTNWSVERETSNSQFRFFYCQEFSWLFAQWPRLREALAQPFSRANASSATALMGQETPLWANNCKRPILALKMSKRRPTPSSIKLCMTEMETCPHSPINSATIKF